jgi:DNA-binding transcriptional MerR regulator
VPAAPQHRPVPSSPAPGPREAPADDRWRVEDFAGRARLSVDTIRFYQKRGLLPPPTRVGRIAWYGPEHLERVERIRDLQRQGFTLAVARRVLDGELDAADVPLALEVSRAGDAEVEPPELLTLDELAQRSGVPPALLRAIGGEGFLVPRRVDGEDRYTTADLDAVRAGLRLLEAGLPLPELIELGRRQHDATRGIAEGAVAMFDQHIRQPLRARDLPDAEHAALLVDAFRALLPTVTTIVAHHFRRVLLQVAQEHLEAVGDPAELAAAEAEAELLAEESIA